MVGLARSRRVWGFVPLQQVDVRSLGEEEERGSHGKLRSTDSGIRSVPSWSHWTDNWHNSAPVEDVRLRRGQHHHGDCYVRRTVDVVRLPEHRPDPVQGVRLHPAAKQ